MFYKLKAAVSETNVSTESSPDSSLKLDHLKRLVDHDTGSWEKAGAPPDTASTVF